MTILFPQDHFTGRQATSAEPTQISQSPSPENLFSAYHSLSWLPGDRKTWYCLLPQFPPLPPAYRCCQRRMQSSSLYIPIPALRGRALRRASWGAGQGQLAEQAPVIWASPLNPPQSCEQGPLESTNSGSLGQPVWGGYFQSSGNGVGSESLETLPRDLTLTRCTYLVIPVGKGSQC